MRANHQSTCRRSSGSGDGVEIVEWKWKSGEEYEEVGVVDAAIA